MKDYAPLYNRRTGGAHYPETRRRAELTTAVLLAMFIGGVFVWVFTVVTG